MALVRRQARTPERSAEFPDLLARSPWSGLLSNWEPFRDLFEETGIPVEEYQEDGTHVVRAEIPGIDPDKDVDITVQDGVLHLRAERRQEDKTEDKDFYRQEIRYGSFARNIPLPPGASEEDVKAEYRDGVLTVRLPITQEKQGTKIPINRR